MLFEGLQSCSCAEAPDVPAGHVSCEWLCWTDAALPDVAVCVVLSGELLLLLLCLLHPDATSNMLLRLRMEVLLLVLLVWLLVLSSCMPAWPVLAGTAGGTAGGMPSGEALPSALLPHILNRCLNCVRVFSTDLAPVGVC